MASSTSTETAGIPAGDPGLAAAGEFIQQEPSEGAPATERTETWILFDDRDLYISARCWDSQPDRMVANELRRDHENVAGIQRKEALRPVGHDEPDREHRPYDVGGDEQRPPVQPIDERARDR